MFVSLLIQDPNKQTQRHREGLTLFIQIFAGEGFNLDQGGGGGGERSVSGWCGNNLRYSWLRCRNLENVNTGDKREHYSHITGEISRTGSQGRFCSNSPVRSTNQAEHFGSEVQNPKASYTPGDELIVSSCGADHHSNHTLMPQKF